MKNQSLPVRRQHGATLIEALVAILLLSLGLLGMASLQLNAMSYQKSAWATQRIAELTADVSEKLRANTKAADSGMYLYTADYSTAKSATMTTAGCATSSDCTSTQIANDDMSALLAKAQSTLPGGALRAEGVSVTGYTVTVMYMDKDYVDPGTGALQASPVCASGTTGFAWRNCCPAAAAVPNGVRCSRSLIFP